MKKITKILTTLLLTGTLVGCSEIEEALNKDDKTSDVTSTSIATSTESPHDHGSTTNNTDTEVSNDNNKPVGPNTEDSEVTNKLAMSDFKHALENSDQTKVFTRMSYYVPDFEVTLNYESTLCIEYSTPIKASYTYKKDHLNPIGSEEMISTITGTNYAKGTDIGELKNGKVEWILNTESVIALKTFTFNQDYFNASNIENFTLNFKLKNDKVVEFFNEDYHAKDVNIKIALNEDKKVEEINMFYIDTTNNAKVNTKAKFSYNIIHVNIPE